MNICLHFDVKISIKIDSLFYFHLNFYEIREYNLKGGGEMISMKAFFFTKKECTLELFSPSCDRFEASRKRSSIKKLRMGQHLASNSYFSNPANRGWNQNFSKCYISVDKFLNSYRYSQKTCKRFLPSLSFQVHVCQNWIALY